MSHPSTQQSSAPPQETEVGLSEGKASAETPLHQGEHQLEPHAHSPSASLWAEVEHSRTLLAIARGLHRELLAAHVSLASLYQPSMEEKAHRLSIERDEALVAWGRSLLGLNALGVSLKLHFEDEHTPPVRACGQEPRELLSYQQQLSQGLSAQEGARVLGSPLTAVELPELERLHVSAQEREEAALGAHEVAPAGTQTQASQEQPTAAPTAELGAETSGEVSAETSAETSGEMSDSPAPHASPAPLVEEEDPLDEAMDDPGVAEAKQVMLTPRDLEDLQAKMSQSSWSGEEEEPAREAGGAEWKDKARELSVRLGGPRNSYTPSELKQTLLELEGEVECCQQWGLFGRDVQNALLALITSRLRKLQGYLGDNVFDQERIAKLFRRLTRYSSDFRPGFVQALSRDKVPAGSSWEADEREAWARLEQQLDIKAPLPKLTTDQAQALEELSALTANPKAPSFENALRQAVTRCLNAHLPVDSPHLTPYVAPHLKRLSGKRFKQLRQAQAQLS